MIIHATSHYHSGEPDHYTRFLSPLTDADSCCLNAAVFASQNEILTGNSRGMIKLWDLRATSVVKPVLTTSLAEDSEVHFSRFQKLTQSIFLPTF